MARRHRRRARRPAQADPRRTHARVFRHWRFEPRRPDAGPARRLGHSRRRQAWQRDAVRARASTTISMPARSSSASPGSISRPRASSSSRNPAARRRRWCRSRPPSTPCARLAWPSVSLSCSSPSPSPRRKERRTASARYAKPSPSPRSTTIRISAAASPASPMSGSCRLWRAGSMRWRCARAPSP